jgi:hypothetical protein
MAKLWSPERAGASQGKTYRRASRHGLTALTLACAIWQGAGAPSAQGALAGAQDPVPTQGSAKVWEGRGAEFETYITSAVVDRIEKVPTGITHPRRMFFAPGGLAGSAAFKVLPPGMTTGAWESYKSEIAAYELDKLLGLGMVPVAVEKRWKNEKGAAILWLERVRTWREIDALPKPEKWHRQMVKTRMFDNLIGNSDRNLGNLLVDADWNVFLIDHSRAFVIGTKLPSKITRIDAELWSKMLSLEEATLMAAVGRWTDRATVRAVLSRRDGMRAAIDKLIKNSSEEAVFQQPQKKFDSQ